MKVDKDTGCFLRDTWLCRMEPSMLALCICLQDDRTLSMSSWWLTAPVWKRFTAHKSSKLTDKHTQKNNF